MLKKSMLFALMLINFNLAFTFNNNKKRSAAHLGGETKATQAAKALDDLAREAQMDLLEYGNLQPRAVGIKYEVVKPWQPLWKPYSPVHLP